MKPGGIRSNRLMQGFGGILLVSTLLLVYSSSVFIEVQQTIQAVEDEFTKATIVIDGDEISTIKLTFVVQNPSKSITIEVLRYKVRIQSLNGNITKSLLKTIYPPYKEKFPISPADNRSFYVEYTEIYETTQPVLQWAFAHEVWNWEISIRVLFGIGYSEDEPHTIHYWNGVDIL